MFMASRFLLLVDVTSARALLRASRLMRPDIAEKAPMRAMFASLLFFIVAAMSLAGTGIEMISVLWSGDFITEES